MGAADWGAGGVDQRGRGGRFKFDAGDLWDCRVDHVTRRRWRFGRSVRAFRSGSAAAETGEPILRPLAYEFPGFEQVNDQFLLG
jgi:hypothetical protein